MVIPSISINRRALLGRLTARGVAAAAGASLVGLAGSRGARAANDVPNGIKFSNVAICVASLEHSARFYREVLGFTPMDRRQFEGAIFGRQLSLGGPAKLANQIIALGDLRIELIQYDKPKYSGAAIHAPTNQPGLTHLAFRFKDLDKVLGAVPKFGGTVLEETRIKLGTLDVVFCTDPDNVRLELGSVT